MENIKLIRITPENLHCFSNYISKDLHEYIYDEDNIAVGCVYDNYSCGAALAIYERNRKYHLLSIYIDEKVRGKGFGKHTLLGLMGLCENNGADSLYVCYADSDFNGEEISPIFSSVGFAGPTSNGTTYVMKWKDLKNDKFFNNIDGDYSSKQEIIPFRSMNEEQKRSYREKIKNDDIPEHLGIKAAKGKIIYDLTYASVRGDEVTGIFITTRIDDYVYINSVYTIEGKYSSFLPLIRTVFTKAKEILDDDEEIKVTAATSVSEKLNKEIFGRAANQVEEEYLLEYEY